MPRTNRRTFLGALPPLAAASGFPTIVSASALGLNGAVPASDRVTIATIGVGWMGPGHVREFLKIPEAQMVAVCDVDEEHLAAAKATVDKKYGDRGCAVYRAFEEVLSRRDIDAVSIATPDNWHGIIAVSAARAKKDIYGEKPLALTFHEGAAIAEAVKRHGRIWQTGSWQRSVENFRRACELVRNGRIGKVYRVEVALPGGHVDFTKTKNKPAPTEPPATLNYDRWLGPAPEAPYRPACGHKSWRWNLDYGGGQLMDWVGHYLDIAHWGLGFDGTGPVEVSGRGEYPPREAVWNTATRYHVTARYREGVTMDIASMGGIDELDPAQLTAWKAAHGYATEPLPAKRGHIPCGTKWIGSEGWIYVTREVLKAEPASLLDSVIKPNEIHLPVSPGHYLDFIQCVKSRRVTLTPAEVALRSATPGWLGQIAMLTGKKIKWDPEKQRITNLHDGEKLLSRVMRAPWQL